jgi:hypothetical protein
MDDSFSILGLNKDSICLEVSELGKEVAVKHFVFDDLLDTGESLYCKVYDLGGGFSSFLYLLRRTTEGILKRAEEKELGCYLGFSKGAVYTFEDFNFKIRSFEEFTLLVEAVEYDSGKSFEFSLVNLCALPERLSSEVKVSLTLYSKSVEPISPLDYIDQMALENKETIELASAGSEKAFEKLEREVGIEETQRLLREFKKEPEKMFDTYIFESTGGNYNIVGTVTSVDSVRCKGRNLGIVDFISEGYELRALTAGKVPSVGERVKFFGKFYGFVVLE